MYRTGCPHPGIPGIFWHGQETICKKNGNPDPLLAGMGEWQKGYQHKMLEAALQR